MLLLLSSLLQAQTTISGVINNYYEVTGLDKCNNSVTLTATPLGLAVGDHVLLIQMRGVDADADNTASYGSILNYAKSGTYEMFTVQNIAFNVVTLNEVMERYYEVAGKVQLVRVPYYTDVDVVGTVTGNNWSGAVGGVIAFISTGVVDFGADIDATGIGFRGASPLINTPCIVAGPLGFDGYVTLLAEDKGGDKGESITENGDNLYARGAPANGGGGGNDRQTGGGGGSNFVQGGDGGQLMFPPVGLCGGTYPGIGGHPLNYDNVSNRIFMGGGGGSGSSNLGLGTGGGNGGGIVMIIANDIKGNGYFIKANGADVTTVALDDGAGGGGGAGTIAMELNTVSTTLNVQVKGGVGGNVDNTFDGINCVGPGGGGSGGLVWLNAAAVPGSMNIDAVGGISGITTGEAAFSPCFNSTNSATAGLTGGFLGSLDIPEPAVPFVELTVDMIPDDAVVCQGNELFMSVIATGTGSLGYHWNDPDSTVTPDCTVIPPYDYIYTVIVTDDLNCQLIGFVEVDVIDTVEVTAYPDTTLELGNSMTLNTNLDDTYTYLWTPVYNINDPTSANPIIDPYETTTYCVTATHPTGCSSTDCVTILVAAAVQMPNAFTPNEDGLNDIFRVPPTANLCEEITYFKVFDRWGQIVYDYFSVSDSEGWDGTDINGISQEIGSYVYVIRMICDGADETFSGMVHLLR
ncbi:MAG: gliding motility-associated C-terminal domain-containing protein [Chitinophagales bacterium]